MQKKHSRICILKIHLLELVDILDFLAELLLQRPGGVRLVGEGGSLLLEDSPGRLLRLRQARLSLHGLD